jgi:CelD/BcsL family acetyltransferase involved in cellulose biosynthesis
MLAWWSVFGGTGKRALRTLAVFDHDRLVGLAPLLVRPYVYRPGIPFRRIELLGSGEDIADETCGDYLGILAEAGRESDVAFALAEALASGTAGKWDEVFFSSMSGDNPMPALLSSAFQSHGLDATLEEWSIAPYVPLPGTWEEYLSALKPSKRSLLRKAMRSFENWAGGEPSIVRVHNASQLAVGMSVLKALHSERWGSQGVFASHQFCAFHDRLMPELLSAGALDLGWIDVRGEPVAAFYNFRWMGKVSFYQSGRRLDIPDGVRVGVAMHAYLIRDAIKDGLREYDFMEGSSQYKMSFAVAMRPLLRLRVVKPSLVEIARVAAARAALWAKSLRDQTRPGVAEATSHRLGLCSSQHLVDTG